MSFKRKNTKPIRVFDENQNNEFTDTSMNYDNTTFDDKDATNGLINTHITEPGSKWQLSLPQDSLSLPTMVNPTSFANYKWSFNSDYTSVNAGSNSPSLSSNGDFNGSPPKKTRKIRYKYKESANADVKYRCEVCQYCTNRSDHYKRHLITHSADKPLKCFKCGYGTGRSDHFRRHLSRHGLSEEIVLKQCEINGIKTGHRARNQNGHLGESDSLAFQQKCSTGDNASSTPSNDVGSFLNQSPQKRYVCDLCGYVTSKLSHYSRHVKIHSEEKPFSCDACGKKFKFDSYLKKHRCPRKPKPMSSLPDNILLDALDCFNTAQSLNAVNPGFPSNSVQFPLMCSSSGNFDAFSDMSAQICSDVLGDL